MSVRSRPTAKPAGMLRPLPRPRPNSNGGRARAELDTPWLPMLQAIESATHDPVYLVALDLDPSTGTLRLEGEASTFDAILAYLQALDAQPALTAVTLVSHAEIAPGGATPTSPAIVSLPRTGPAPQEALLRFSASAQWRRP